MSNTHAHRRKRLWQNLQIATLGCLSVIVSFTVGIRTAGDVQTVAPTEATGMRMSGDINNDEQIDTEDVIAILEVARGYRSATPEELLADPNADGRLTIDDALRILHDLSAR